MKYAYICQAIYIIWNCYTDVIVYFTLQLINIQRQHSSLWQPSTSVVCFPVPINVFGYEDKWTNWVQIVKLINKWRQLEYL
jgi:hypothetical protein